MTTQNLVIFIIGLVVLLIWLTFYFIGYKHAYFFEPLDEKDYPLKEIYFVGYSILNTFQYSYKSKGDRKLRKEIEVLYGAKDREYYLKVLYSQRLTISLTVLVFAFILYGLANDIAMLFIVVAFAALAYYYFGTLINKRITKRSDEMLHDFPDVISKLALLTNAGMILKEAWYEVAYTGNSVLYLEMQKTVEEMDNGVSEIDALFRFGTRCIIPEIKKFTSTITQSLVKGNSELSMMLQVQSKEVWFAKKQNIARQGEQAASKLMIPILIMFIGILIMILVPIFTNIGV